MSKIAHSTAPHRPLAIAAAAASGCRLPRIAQLIELTAAPADVALASEVTRRLPLIGFTQFALIEPAVRTAYGCQS
jgi:hypothetical protein